MPNTATKTIVNNWSLLEFIRAKGIPMLGEFTNKDTGEVFTSLMFPSPSTTGKNTPVSFSQNLDITKTLESVFEHRRNLQVVELDSGSFILCKQGEGGWEKSVHSEAEWGV